MNEASPSEKEELFVQKIRQVHRPLRLCVGPSDLKWKEVKRPLQEMVEFASEQGASSTDPVYPDCPPHVLGQPVPSPASPHGPNGAEFDPEDEPTWRPPGPTRN